MSEAHRRLSDLLDLCNDLTASLDDGHLPDPADIERLHQSLTDIHPPSPTDLLNGLWHTLRALEIWLAIAADEAESERGSVVGIAVQHLDLAVRQLSLLLAANSRAS